MHVWMENVTLTQFEVCLQESRALDGGHNKIVVVSDEFIKKNDFITNLFTIERGIIRISKVPNLRYLPLPLFIE